MLHVLLEPNSPQARYIARHLLGRFPGWPLAFVEDRQEFARSLGPKVIYGPEAVDGAFHIPADGTLAPSGEYSQPTLSLQEHAHRDPLAAAFRLLSLHDEYKTAPRDHHERLPADALTIVRENLHLNPLVDRWALELVDRLRDRFPQLPPPRRCYQHILTVDVDNGLKYAARSFTRALGASARDLTSGRPGNVLHRWRVRAGADVDPYASFVTHLASVRPDVQRIIAFVLTRGEGRFDHAARTDHPVFRELLGDLKNVAEIGLHPSYESSRMPALLHQERSALAAACSGAPALITRQHFLRWKLPETFRELISAGFTEDHSLGFSDREGFRAGTCTPFPWFDLQRGIETELLLHPFATMDSALAQQSGEELRRASGRITAMSDAVRAVRGTFISVWHDRYLSGDDGFAGAPEVMRQLVQHAKA